MPELWKKISYQKSEDLYYKNARPSDMEIIFSDGTKEEIHIHDEMGWVDYEMSELWQGDTR